VTGDWSVMDRVHALPVSLQLMLLQVLALVVAIPFGVATAYRRPADRAQRHRLRAAGHTQLRPWCWRTTWAQAGWLPVSGYVVSSEDLLE
jgi:hypothetical protein